MKKIYATIAFALMAMPSFAQEQNDTTYVMFDFNQNPWNYPTTGVGRGWSPDYDDETGFIMEEPKTFDWTIEGTDKKVNIIVSPKSYYDPEENVRPPLLYYGPNYDKDNQGNISTTMLWTNPGATVRFVAPEGMKFGKMIFWFYRNSYFPIDTEEELEEEREGTAHKDTHKVWIPTTPKVNQNSLECWQGDETNILFDYIYQNAVYEKIDIRLVPDGTVGICEKKVNKQQNTLFDLQGRQLKVIPQKGIYVADGKKIIK